jgi:hypothetical protein
MNTSELTGAALDWAVAQIESGAGPDKAEKQWRYFGRVFHPSTDWAQGGPIIEREAMCISRTNKTNEVPWAAYIDGHYWVDGPTPLVAAMRCYVASKLGNTVDIPEELTK